MWESTYLLGGIEDQRERNGLDQKIDSSYRYQFLATQRMVDIGI